MHASVEKSRPCTCEKHGFYYQDAESSPLPRKLSQKQAFEVDASHKERRKLFSPLPLGIVDGDGRERRQGKGYDKEDVNSVPSVAFDADNPHTDLRESQFKKAVAHLHTLQLLASSYYSRLMSTNTLSLNRRLRRTFEISELTHLSNTIISNIMGDIQSMPSHFTDKFAYPKIPFPNDTQTSSKLDDSPPLIVVQQLASTISCILAEIGHLRKTVNEVGLAYVTKMEEMGLKDAQSLLSAAAITSPTPSSTSSSPSLPPSKSLMRASTLKYFRRRQQHPDPINPSNANIAPQSIPSGKLLAIPQQKRVSFEPVKEVHTAALRISRPTPPCTSNSSSTVSHSLDALFHAHDHSLSDLGPKKSNYGGGERDCQLM